jgi:diguanylate cyclase (GGDEF)-like protein
MLQLMDAASIDALTGCLSRGAFEDHLAHEAKRSGRHGGTFSLIVADADNLKTLNDSNGHHSGDRALRLLARILEQAARESDVVGRLGGDEFALLLHGADEAAAMAAANRLTGALRAVPDSDAVTASLGVTTWQGPHDDVDSLLRRGDEALYVAKRAGRNRAAQWEPPSSDVSEVPAGPHRLARHPRRSAASRTP